MTIMGHAQQGREGFGLEKTKPMWQKVTPAEHHLSVEEEHHQEASRCAKAISQANQGRWMKWDAIEGRKIS